MVTADTLYITLGRDNVIKWADLDNNGDEATIQNRIDHAIEYANESFKSMVFGRDIPDNIVVDDVVARIAGVWLYESRGLAEEDAEKSPVAHHRKFIKVWVQGFLAQKINFTKPISPFIVP